MFVVQGARPVTDTPLQPHSVWLGERDQVIYGVITSPIVSSGGMPAQDLQRHALLGAVQRCYASEDFVRLLESGPFDIAKIFDDLATTSFGSTTVQVQGHPVLGCTVAYGGVAFVGGSDPMSWPFLVARRADVVGDWPALEQIPAERPIPGHPAPP